MTYTSVSTKYQVVIPKEVRRKMDLKPGQRLVVYEKGGIVHLVPEIPMKKLRGMFRGRGIEEIKGLRDKADRPL